MGGRTVSYTHLDVYKRQDQSAGRENGQTDVDVSINGGVTPFSAQSETVVIEVLPVDDLPLVDLNGAEEGTGFSPQFFGAGATVVIADSDQWGWLGRR